MLNSNYLENIQKIIELTLISAGVNIKRRTTVAGIEIFASSRPPAQSKQGRGNYF